MSRAIYGLDALRALEARAQQQGIDLMARAAQACTDWIASRWPPGAHLLLAAGPGNNGGDALCAAPLLAASGFHVEVWLPVTPQSPATRQALARWQVQGGCVLTELPAHYPRPDLVVDGWFGIGTDRPFSAEWQQRIARLNALGAPVLALDTPSGLDAWRGTIHNAAVQADATLTFLSHKPGLIMGTGRDLAGRVYLASLQHPGWAGDAPEGAVFQPGALSALRRQHNSHKGSYGTVGVVGGASGMLGAGLLAGRAALAAGAGKVRLAALDPRLPVDPLAPELMIVGAETLPEGDVLAVGPGLGQSPAALTLLQAAIAGSIPLLLDADALNLLAQDAPSQTALAARQAATVLTPHPAEAARLLATTTTQVQADRLQAARTLASRFNAVVLLKGAGSLSVGPDGYYHVNPSGGPALAAAGQGDVLSGLIAALLAQGMDAFAAASLGAYVHGCVGDRYTRQHGGPIGLTAAATANALAMALNALLPPEPDWQDPQADDATL